jgi:hypothetical protein
VLRIVIHDGDHPIVEVDLDSGGGARLRSRDAADAGGPAAQLVAAVDQAREAAPVTSKLTPRAAQDGGPAPRLSP